MFSFLFGRVFACVCTRSHLWKSPTLANKHTPTHTDTSEVDVFGALHLRTTRSVFTEACWELEIICDEFFAGLPGKADAREG